MAPLKFDEKLSNAPCSNLTSEGRGNLKGKGRTSVAKGVIEGNYEFVKLGVVLIRGRISLSADIVRARVLVPGVEGNCCSSFQESILYICIEMVSS